MIKKNLKFEKKCVKKKEKKVLFFPVSVLIVSCEMSFGNSYTGGRTGMVGSNLLLHVVDFTFYNIIIYISRFKYNII